jgi:hypothetical protein
MDTIVSPDRSIGLGPITRVAAPSLSFGQHPGLVERLRAKYPDARINTEGKLIHLNEDELIDYLRGYEAALVSLEWITDRVLASLPELRVVVKLGVGLDKIDPYALKKHGVRLGWKAGVNALSVAELTICTAIMALRHVLSRNLMMREGKRPMQAMGSCLPGGRSEFTAAAMSAARSSACCSPSAARSLPTTSKIARPSTPNTVSRRSIRRSSGRARRSCRST